MAKNQRFYRLYIHTECVSIPLASIHKWLFLSLYTYFHSFVLRGYKKSNRRIPCVVYYVWYNRVYPYLYEIIQQSAKVFQIFFNIKLYVCFSSIDWHSTIQFLSISNNILNGDTFILFFPIF